MMARRRARRAVRAAAAFRPGPVFVGTGRALGRPAGSWPGRTSATRSSTCSCSWSPAGWCRCACTSTRTRWSPTAPATGRVADRGYLTLNPLKYTHPLLSIVLPVVFVLLGGIGLPGGAVWVDQHAIRGRLRHSLISRPARRTNVLFADRCW